MQMIETQLLDRLGIGSNVKVWMDLSPAELYEHALRRDEAALVSSGAIVAETGQHTGRSPKDKFFVEEPETEGDDLVGGQPADLARQVPPACSTRWTTSAPATRSTSRTSSPAPTPSAGCKVQVITEFAWHSLFAQNLFIRPDACRAAWTSSPTSR